MSSSRHIHFLSSICRMNLNASFWVDFLSEGFSFKVVENSSPMMRRNILVMLVWLALSVRIVRWWITPVEECTFFQPVRQEFPLLFNNWSSLPMQAKTYSLFGSNRRYMTNFWAYIAFHSHIFIDWRTTTFTLHLLMDHANRKTLTFGGWFRGTPFRSPLQRGLKGLGARGGTKVWRSKGASPSEGFKGASRGLQGGLKGASPWRGRGLQWGFKGACRGLQAFSVEGGFEGAWRGLEGGFIRGLEAFSLKEAWRGFGHV